MANKNVDPTKEKQATTWEDVNNQDARTRLWQSLDYTYGLQRDKSNEQYDQAYSQQGREALKRGLGRSSYLNQTQANLLDKKAKAYNEIYGAQIADYQNRLTDIENQEK